MCEPQKTRCSLVHITIAARHGITIHLFVFHFCIYVSRCVMWKISSEPWLIASPDLALRFPRTSGGTHAADVGELLQQLNRVVLEVRHLLPPHHLRGACVGHLRDDGHSYVSTGTLVCVVYIIYGVSWFTISCD